VGIGGMTSRRTVSSKHMSRTQKIADDLVVIDLNYDNTAQVDCAYLLLGPQPALVETGPTATVENLLAGVREAGLDPAALQAIAVTHIHLDHAGGAGALVQRFPHLRVYVHPIGAPHLIDPTKLVASAGRLYGEDMGRLFGDVIPIPADRVHAIANGETVQLGARRLAALDTPGHARHHHVYWDRTNGDLFTGDLAGVALPGSHYVRAPTPPPELDIPAWERSLEKVRSLRPKRLLLTHFGPHTAVDDILAQLDDSLHQNLHFVQSAMAAGEDESTIIARAREDALQAIARRDGPTARARFEVIMPVRQSVLGLMRYIRKSEERAREASG
jgi:glyoxylase-like metal-dependent hydrolase (beta-lactamase superfamily II)